MKVTGWRRGQPAPISCCGRRQVLAPQTSATNADEQRLENLDLKSGLRTDRLRDLREAPERQVLAMMELTHWPGRGIDLDKLDLCAAVLQLLEAVDVGV